MQDLGSGLPLIWSTIGRRCLRQMGSLKHENPVNTLCHLSWEQKQLSNRKRIRSVCASQFFILIESLTFLSHLEGVKQLVFP